MKRKLRNVTVKCRDNSLSIFFIFQVNSTASIPSFFGIFVDRLCTSMATGMLLSEIFSMLLIFCMKYVDLCSFKFSYKWWSRNFKIFVVWQWIELTTGIQEIPCLFTLFMSIYNQKIKVRHQSIQKKIRDQRILKIDWKTACQRLACSKQMKSLSYLHGKKQSQTSIHAMFTKDQRIVKSDWPRTCQVKSTPN